MNQITSSMFNVNGVSENVMAAKNTMNVENTPRKVPFSDKTNKSSELLKSAIKGTASQSSISQQTSSSSGSGKIQEKEATYDDFEYFVFPPDKNCFCCGDNRKTDGEIYGEKLALNVDFLEKLLSPFDTVDMDPPSPLSFSPVRRIEMREFLLPILCMDDIDYENADYGNYPAPSLDDSDSDMEVPDDDLCLDFSFDVGSKDTVDCDDSIIQHW